MSVFSGPPQPDPNSGCSDDDLLVHLNTVEALIVTPNVHNKKRAPLLSASLSIVRLDVDSFSERFLSSRDKPLEVPDVFFAQCHYILITGAARIVQSGGIVEVQTRHTDVAR